MANLRILYDNVFNSAVTTASSTSTNTSVSNLYLTKKSAIWRSTANTATLTMDWPSAVSLSCIILPFTNLTPSSTLRVRMYGASNNLLRDISNITGVTDTLATGGVSSFSFGGGSYAVAWFTRTTTVRKLILDIVDTNNPTGAIEISSVLAGEYWSPTYNTGFGITVGYEDTSVQERTESGDLLTETNYIYKTLSFDLEYMNNTDRDIMLSIIRRIGKRGSVFVSIFPEDTEAGKEAIYQIYGKFKDLATITHPIFSMYATSVSIEEI